MFVLKDSVCMSVFERKAKNRNVMREREDRYGVIEQYNTSGNVVVFGYPHRCGSVGGTKAEHFWLRLLFPSNTEFKGAL